MYAMQDNLACLDNGALVVAAWSCHCRCATGAVIMGQLLQIYSGYMQRTFVPVEQRGTSEHDANVDAPIQLRNDNPHTDHNEDANGNGEWQPVACHAASNNTQMSS